MKCYWLNFGYNESNNGFGLYLILNKLGHLSKQKIKKYKNKSKSQSRDNKQVVHDCPLPLFSGNVGAYFFLLILFLLKIASFTLINFVVAFCFRYILNRYEATFKATSTRGNYYSFLILVDVV